VDTDYCSKISVEKMTAKRVLYLSYDGLTDPLGQSQILPYIKGLSQLGYRFTIISFEKQQAYRKHKSDVATVCKQHGIDWLPQRYHKWPPVLSTLFDVWVLWRNVKQQNRRNPFKIIHCRSYITSLVGLRAKRQWGVKFIFDMRGFWADERVEGGLWKLNNPLFRMVYHFFKKKERQFLIESDYVVSLTENAKQEILSWNISVVPISVLPTCVDLELFNPAKIVDGEKGSLRKKLGLEETDFIVLYLGSWGTWYLMEEMFNFFADFKQLKTNSKFLIVSPDKVEVPDALAASVVVRSVSRAEVPLYVSLADLGVLFIKPSYSKKASSATKLGEMMAMQIPIVTNVGWGDVHQLSLENSDVITISEFSKEVAASLASRIVSSKKPTAHNLRGYSLQDGVAGYAKVYAFVDGVNS
jgi:glycosyltransferase involved in cell wall biosynthesis